MANGDMAAALRKPSGMDGLFGVGAPALNLAAGKTVPLPDKKEDTDMDKRKIILIRHGATTLNNDDVSVDRIRGWKDVPLSDEGKEEAQRVAKKIKNGPMTPDILIPSDLERTQETAQIIAKLNNVPLGKPTQGFRPWNVGKLAGQLTSKAIPVLAAYATNKPDQTLPEGESFNTFKQRFLTGLHSTLKQNPGIVGVVTHHRNERLLKAWAKDGFHKEGDINIGEFNKKGEHTGSAEELHIPMSHLAAAVDSMDMAGRGFGEVMNNSSDRAKAIHDMPETTE